MNFPLWQYLNQPLFDTMRPTILNPRRYWQIYSLWYLERCLNNTFLEQCWNLDYQQFIDCHSVEDSILDW
jgi:hypothetical protein